MERSSNGGAPKSISIDVVTAGRRVGTVRQSDSGADPLASLGEVPLSPVGTGPQAGRRAPSDSGGSMPIVPLSPTPREMRTSNNGPRPAPINPSAHVKSPTSAPPSPAILSIPEPEPAPVNAPPSPVSKAVFKPGMGSMNGRPAGPSILDETLAVEKPIKPGKGGFTAIPAELNEPLDETELMTCQNCGRRFNPKSYEKHVGTCEKLNAQPKREIYSSLGSRVKDTPTEKAESSWRDKREDLKRAMNQSRQAAREEGGL